MDVSWCDVTDGKSPLVLHVYWQAVGRIGEA